jgi:hypothetical protein
MGAVYRVNRPKVISEVFEDEVVAINFDTGSYYGMSQTALAIWRLLEHGASAETVTQHLASRYNQDPTAIESAVCQFFEQLLQNNLITEAVGNGAGTGPEIVAGNRTQWEPPALSVYDDMQDLLLLDPIHDVDEAGWPARKPDGLP